MDLRVESSICHSFNDGIAVQDREFFNSVHSRCGLLIAHYVDVHCHRVDISTDSRVVGVKDKESVIGQRIVLAGKTNDSINHSVGVVGAQHAQVVVYVYHPCRIS